MITRKILTGLTAVFLTVLSFSCTKDGGSPTIRFMKGPNFTGKDTVIRVNYELPVAIEVFWNGTDLLKQLDINRNDMLFGTYAISGDTSRFTFNVIKTADATEKYTFIIRDVKENQASLSITLTKDPNSEFGSIKYYGPVVLGAQNNIVKPAFISFQDKTGTIFNLDQAFVNQSKIELMYYFDGTTQSTLAGPGSDIPDNLYPGSRNIALWATRNEAKFLKTALLPADFQSINTDAPIVNAWSETQSVTKAVQLKANEVWLVKLKSGRKGAILVNRVLAGEDGELEFYIKIQE